MDTDRIRLVLEEGAERVKRDPAFAIKLSAGVVLCLTGFILFLVEARRSNGVQDSNYVTGFPMRDELAVTKTGMVLPAVTICPTVSLDAAGSTGLGQITNMKCIAAGYDPVPMPPVTIQSVIIKKLDFVSDKLSNYACWNVNADMKYVSKGPGQTIKCDGYFSNLNGLSEAEASVTYWDPRKGSLDAAPSTDEFLWHSLQSTAFTSMYIEPTEIVLLNGNKDWFHQPHFGEHFKYNFTQVKNSAGTQPGISLNYGFKFMFFKQMREVNLYTSNQFWGVMGGLLYLLVGIYSLVLAGLGFYGLGDGNAGGDYKVVNPNMPVITPNSGSLAPNPYEQRPGLETSTQPGGSGYGTL